MAFIKIKDLSYYYPETKTPALDKINLEIFEGQFVLVVGGSGSGKSSLVRVLSGLIPEFYGGTYKGKVYIDDREIKNMNWFEIVQKVGMVGQHPESQLVMNDVEQEVAFGMENIGLSNSLMKRRVMEIARGLGISNLLHSYIPELSSGQKQKVALASVLAMQPEILLLDEPTSQLDPVASEEILSIVKHLNEENGITIIMVEQRLERCFHLADRVIVMDKGKIVYDHDDPAEIARWGVKNNFPFIPPLPKLFAGVGYPEVPLTVKQGRQLLKSISSSGFYSDTRALSLQRQRAYKKEHNALIYGDENLVDIENLWFVYDNGNEALKNINIKVKSGDFAVILGENAAGKTTLLKIIAGLLKPGRGKVKVFNKDIRNTSVEELAGSVGYLSQNPNDYLSLPSVRKELSFTLKNLGLSDNGRVEETLKKLQLTRYADVDPRDLSTGERQRVALASVLVAKPKLLLLDEPTRGLDYHLKRELGNILLQLQAEGTAVLLVTHDVEFAAEFARDVILMAEGTIIDTGSKYDVLTRSTFYSPQVNKLFYNIKDDVVILDEAEAVLNQLVKQKARKWVMKV